MTVVLTTASKNNMYYFHTGQLRLISYKFPSEDKSFRLMSNLNAIFHKYTKRVRFKFSHIQNALEVENAKETMKIVLLYSLWGFGFKFCVTFGG